MTITRFAGSPSVSSLIEALSKLDPFAQVYLVHDPDSVPALGEVHIVVDDEEPLLIASVAGR